jgi:hypothetical protein
MIIRVTEHMVLDRFQLSGNGCGLNGLTQH